MKKLLLLVPLIALLSACYLPPSGPGYYRSGYCHGTWTGRTVCNHYY